VLVLVVMIGHSCSVIVGRALPGAAPFRWLGEGVKELIELAFGCCLAWIEVNRSGAKCVEGGAWIEIVRLVSGSVDECECFVMRVERSD
jgi:hypothetical protein